MRFLILLFPFLPLGTSFHAQPTTPITTLFRGMAASDTSGLAAQFLPSATLHSVATDSSGRTTLRETPIAGFLAALAGAPPGALLEELHSTEIRVDGDLATAWTPYTFVYNGTVNHCGVNTFRLLRNAAGDGRWQIQSIVDTRQLEGCARRDATPATQRIAGMADAWHAAAAAADSAAFFDRLTEDAIYIGTDSSEHWTKREFLAFAAPYFARGKAWAFTATDRHVFLTDSPDVAYFDELLDTWMGKCRGTAIVRLGPDRLWRIAHYTLSVTVPNEKIEEFIELTGK